MTKMVKTVAEAYGGQAEIDIFDTTDITYNDPELTASLIPTLNNVLGEENVILSKAVTGAEDFSYFQSEVPGFYFFLGGMSKNSTEAYPHHTPDFFIDESGLIFGVKSMTEITLNYLNAR
jgi:amidohydrolase